MHLFELKDREGTIYLKARIEKPNPWIYAQWLGVIDVVQLQEGIEAFTEFLHTTHCPYLITDRRLAQGNWFEINTWLQNIWIPKAVREGLQNVAHVVADDFQSKLSGQDLENRVLGINFKIFETLEEAETWMNSIIESNNTRE